MSRILFGIQSASFEEFCSCLLLWQPLIGEGEAYLVNDVEVTDSTFFLSFFFPFQSFCQRNWRQQNSWMILNKFQSLLLAAVGATVQWQELCRWCCYCYCLFWCSFMNLGQIKQIQDDNFISVTSLSSCLLYQTSTKKGVKTRKLL